MSTTYHKETELIFRFTRFFSWTSLILILASSIILALFIGNSARNTLTLRQQQYALLIAKNLNHQIYRRFTLPTFLTFGRIELRQEAQYQQLNDVILSTIHGLHIDTLRIYGADNVINYSLFKEELGKEELMPPNVPITMDTGIPSFETISNIHMLFAIFMLTLPEKSFILRTIFPLTVKLNSYEELDIKNTTPIITGVLEITQDTTEDYIDIVRFQRTILVTCIGSSLFLFFLLQFVIVKAERILSERLKKNRILESEIHKNENFVSMGRVIASIAHELRNPLGIIRSSTELLLKRLLNIETINKRILQAIYDESCRLSQTINDFLDYAHPKIPRQEQLDLNTIIDQVLQFLEGSVSKKNISIVRKTENPLQLLGDKNLLYRALYNIFINALQSIKDGGEICISGFKNSKNMIELHIHDSGQGFPPKGLQQILMPFYTTKDQGIGLGLPIVNSIITSHHGKLELTNAPSGGALVSIFLPASDHQEKSIVLE